MFMFKGMKPGAYFASPFRQN